MISNGHSEDSSSNQDADASHQEINEQQPRDRQVNRTVNNAGSSNEHVRREGHNQGTDTQGTETGMLQRTWDNIFSRRETTLNSTDRPLNDNGVENLAWGHPLNEKDPQHTRLYPVNINGLSIDRDGGKFDEFCQVMDEVQKK
jgi:hypothetical protein